VVLLSKTLCQEWIANWARERHVNDPANMHMPYFSGFLWSSFYRPWRLRSKRLLSAIWYVGPMKMTLFRSASVYEPALMWDLGMREFPPETPSPADFFLNGDNGAHRGSQKAASEGQRGSIGCCWRCFPNLVRSPYWSIHSYVRNLSDKDLFVNMKRS
jgi:hypothetical protein